MLASGICVLGDVLCMGYKDLQWADLLGMCLRNMYLCTLCCSSMVVYPRAWTIFAGLDMVLRSLLQDRLHWYS